MVNTKTQKWEGNRMRKNDLENGMIVRSSDGRFGVVCLEDATDSNCIKFFYNPGLIVNHGLIANAKDKSFVVSLDRFTDDLKYICSCEEANKLGIITNESIFLWSIVGVFSLRKEWSRRRCYSSCKHLNIRKDDCDNEAVGYCKKENDAYVGPMSDIHHCQCYCVGCD